MAHLAVMDRSIQETHVWLNDLKELLGSADDQSAYAALRAVLHQLRDRLTVQGAADLAAQLPLFIRGVYFENFMPQRMPETIRRRADFINGVAAKLRGHEELNAEMATRAVFTLLEEKISGGEVEDIMDALPADIHMLWPKAAQERIIAKHGNGGAASHWTA